MRASVGNLHDLAGGLDDEQIALPSYCDEWSIAQVLSHLGSGAVIFRRGLDDARAGSTAPDDFNQSVWDEWDAKAPRAQAEDALIADEALTEALESIDEAERARLTFSMGPMTLGFDQYIGFRLNDHAFHVWDIAVTFDAAARLSDAVVPPVLDNLATIVGFSGRPDGQERTVAVHTTDPERDFVLRIGSDGVVLEDGGRGQQPDLELPAEAFARLIYGRLDPEHTPPFTGDAAVLDGLRAVFPGF